jgi:hypothetical protein
MPAFAMPPSILPRAVCWQRLLFSSLSSHSRLFDLFDALQTVFENEAHRTTIAWPQTRTPASPSQSFEQYSVAVASLNTLRLRTEFQGPKIFWIPRKIPHIRHLRREDRIFGLTIEIVFMYVD